MLTAAGCSLNSSNPFDQSCERHPVRPGAADFLLRRQLTPRSSTNGTVTLVQLRRNKSNGSWRYAATITASHLFIDSVRGEFYGPACSVQVCTRRREWGSALCALVLARLHQNVQGLAFASNDAPQIHTFAVYRNEDLIQMPAHIGAWMCLPQRLGVGEAEFYRPSTHGFMRHIDARLGQQIFDIPKAQRKPEI
jgi:hypothetical protein